MLAQQVMDEGMCFSMPKCVVIESRGEHFNGDMSTNLFNELGSSSRRRNVENLC